MARETLTAIVKLQDQNTVRVLVIEDDTDIAKAVKAMLERRNLAVDLARDSDEGLEAILRGSYDAAIVEVALPKRDGFTICRNARSGGISTPILILTARDAVEDRVRGLDCRGRLSDQTVQR